ncbi:MAG: hypothetical protein IKI11_09175 [Neisseriaceae bacterium]|nr:hypothetical protein [Neisseriaceae bacterium]
MGNLLPTRFYSTIGKLKNILALLLYLYSPPDKLTASIYRRLPRRAYDTARNDELGYRVGILAHHNAGGVVVGWVSNPPQSRKALINHLFMQTYRFAGGLETHPTILFIVQLCCF